MFIKYLNMLQSRKLDASFHCTACHLNLILNSVNDWCWWQFCLRSPVLLKSHLCMKIEVFFLQEYNCFYPHTPHPHVFHFLMFYVMPQSEGAILLLFYFYRALYQFPVDLCTAYQYNGRAPNSIIGCPTILTLCLTSWSHSCMSRWC